MQLHLSNSILRRCARNARQSRSSFVASSSIVSQIPSLISRTKRSNITRSIAVMPDFNGCKTIAHLGKLQIYSREYYRWMLQIIFFYVASRWYEYVIKTLHNYNLSQLLIYQNYILITYKDLKFTEIAVKIRNYCTCNPVSVFVTLYDTHNVIHFCVRLSQDIQHRGREKP